MTQTILLLDVMGTLVSEPFVKEIPEFLGLSLDELRARQNRPVFHEFERGAIDEASYAARYFLDGPLEDVAGMRRTLREGTRLLPGVEATLERLKAAGVPTYALSNYSVWFEEIDAATGLSRYLEWKFVSCKTGVRKPDPEAYLGPARTLGVPPEACLFVDDRDYNVEAAREVGMRAIHRTPELDLGAALEAAGVFAR